MPEEAKRLGYSFSRRLPLRRASISEVLRLAVDGSEITRKGSRFDWIYEQTSLGTIDAQASAQWARGFGLVNSDGEVTDFGTLVAQNDPGLNRPSTQWICHYHMVAPHRVGPHFWFPLCMSAFAPGNRSQTGSVAAIVRDLSVNSGETELAPGTYEAAAVAFLTSYSTPDGRSDEKSNGLDGLRLLEKQGDAYVPSTPRPVPWRVAAYVLADHWDAVWKDRNSVAYSEVMSDQGPAALLMLDSGTMGRHLTRMMQEGHVIVDRTIRPYTVARNWSGKNTLLEAVYADDSEDEA